MRWTRVLLSATLLAVLWMGGAPARAAENGELVQAVGDSRVYYIEGPLKRWVKDFATFQAWGFNVGAIKRISKAELNGHPTGPAMTRLIDYAGNVYYVDGGQRKWVPSFDVVGFYGLSPSDVVLLNTDTFNRLAAGPTLTAPIAFRLTKDTRVYLIDSGYRRPFASDDVIAHWGLNKNTVPVNDSLRRLPIGPTVTRLVNIDGNVYWMMGGEKHYISSEHILLYNNLSWRDLSPVTGVVGAQLPEGGWMQAPALIATAGDHKVWLTDDNGTRHHVPSLQMLYDLGLNLNMITWVPSSVAYRYPEAHNVTRFMRDLDGKYFLVMDGVRHEFNGEDAVQRRILGVTLDDLRPFGRTVIGRIYNSTYLYSGIEVLDGYRIPALSGKVGREQHLYLGADEAGLGRTDASAQLHYSRSGTPDNAKNGMAGGYGAFGSSASPPSAEQERYYINMRWTYCDWNDSTGCSSFSASAKNWHRHKKVVVTNPVNGRQLIASVEDFGPAIWTGRVSGLSPEAMNDLGVVTDDTLTYLWAIDQNIALGRIR